MKSQKSRKKKLLVASTALALMAALSGTFAWYTEQDQRINRIASSAAISDGTVVVEEKWEPKPINPGAESTKEVKVTNNNQFPVYVRVSYEEVLKHLVSKGVITSKNARFEKPNNPVLTDDVPVGFDGGKYSVANGYTDITTKVKIGGAALPATVKVMAKGSVTHNVSTGTDTRTFEYVMFNEYETGKYQKVNSKVEVIGTPAAGSAVNTWDFEASNITYDVYAGGFAYAKANWAESALPSSVSAPADYAILGASGQKHGENFDYREATIGTLPSVTKGSGAQVPTAANDQKEIQTDKAALGKSGIQIKYGSDIVTDAGLSGATAENKWIYNTEDGWFYYTSPVKKQTSTKDLLKSLKIANDIGDAFKMTEYDLIVKMEAIEANKDAMKEAWKMDTDTAGTKTKTIADFILAQPLN